MTPTELLATTAPYLLSGMLLALGEMGRRGVLLRQEREANDALRADLDRANAATWAARAERDDALISNEHLFDAVCHMHQERTQMSLALHGEPQHLPWHAGDYTVRDELKSGKAG